MVVASKSHLTEETKAYIGKYRVADFKSAGSSLKFCLVATGEADLYPRVGRTMEWDTAAGHAVLAGAGGQVVRFDDHTPLTYGKDAYANPYFIALSPGGRAEAGVMATLPVSIVVVSRDRPESLIWCLTGIDGLDYPEFEVVVVACPAGCAAIQAAGYEARIKLVEFDEANISAARNRGIEQAAGEIVAFIDDDAVPEPSWLSHLAGVFEPLSVAAAGGYVRGRNGISFQWKAREVDHGGRARPLDMAGDAPDVPLPAPGFAVKTEGTNMAVRRDVLAGIGGFDPGFRFYLDETDLNLRLEASGRNTAIVPLAQVHHAYAESARRRADRAVTDLSEIGASAAYFLRKHCPQEERPDRLNRLMQEQQMRVFDQVKERLLRKSDVGPLIDGLKRGVADGQGRPINKLPRLGPPGDVFLKFGPARRGGTVLAGRIWHAKRLRHEAAERAAVGENVSLYLFGPSARYHKVRFTRDGYWEQNGGLFGRSDRSDPIFLLTGFSARLQREVDRVAAMRVAQIGANLIKGSHKRHTGKICRTFPGHLANFFGLWSTICHYHGTEKPRSENVVSVNRGSGHEEEDHQGDFSGCGVGYSVFACNQVGAEGDHDAGR